MSEFALTPRSGLEQVLAPGRYGAENATPGVTITLRDDVALAMVMARAGKSAELAQRANASFGIDLPLTPRYVQQGAVGFTWAGPGRWLASMQSVPPHVFERRLREEFLGPGSVSNQSDGRSVIRLTGPRLRETLAKGVPIDLNPRAFAPGDTALTVVAHINIHFWQIDATPAYEFAVFRSFAGAFCEWLLAASAEFGTEVLAASAPSPR